MPKTLLFNPGPTNVSSDVRSALTREDVCHREPEFFDALKRVNENIVEILGGRGTYSAALFTSSGTGCNEAIMSSMHGKALIVNNGKYSTRLCEIAMRYGIPFERLEIAPLAPMNINLIREALDKSVDITHICVVHHETTTGVVAPLRRIGELAAEYDKHLVVDAISSIGGHAFDLQKDNVALCSVSANKCLESFPGLSFVIGKTDVLKQLEGKSRSFYFDLYAQWKKGLDGEMPFTPAVQLVFALDVALKRLKEEGYENRVRRYQTLTARMRDGLKRLGFELLLLSDELQSNILTAIRMPGDMDYQHVHDELKRRGITIYSDRNVLAQGKFRVATLGSISENDVDWFLNNLGEVMNITSPTANC